MTIDESNKYGALDVNRLLRFEKRIGARLPEDYRQFLIEHNGGKPFPCDFKISEIEGEDSLHHFYGLHNGPLFLSLEKAYETYKGRMPNTMIPFADDPAGNAICIGIVGNDAGRVFFWDHELEREGDEQTFCKNTAVIADSFSAFLDELFEWVNPDETAIDKIVRTNDLTALSALLDSDYNIETTNDRGRTIIEEAAIAANCDMVRLLLERRAQVRNALVLAEKNAEYFDENKAIVLLIRNFLSRRG